MSPSPNPLQPASFQFLPSPKLLEQDPGLLASYSQLQIVRYVTVSAATFFVWENAVNLFREVELIWRSRWSLMKALYLLARYTTYFAIAITVYAILFDGSAKHIECELQLQFGWPCIYAMSVSAIIMQLRVHAIYNQRKWTIINLTLLYVITHAPGIVIYALLSPIKIEPIPGTPFCARNSPYPVVSTLCTWVAPMFFELILLVLVCYKSYQHYQDATHIGKSRGFRLMRVLVRDSAIYFLVGFTLYLVNALIWLFCPPGFLELGTLWTVVGTAAAATRMVLNLREENSMQAPPVSLTTLSTQN